MKSFSFTLLVHLAFLVCGCHGYSPENVSKFDVWEDNEIGDGRPRKCPVAFHEIGGRCYFYGYFKLNWFRAMEFCHSFGSTVSLACIETKDENEHLKEWLLEHGDHTTGVWVGGSDNGHIGRWAWFPTGQLIRNFNWGPSQPSGGDQHCMYIVGGYLGYQWADFHCGFEMTFLCEHEVNPFQAWRRRRNMLRDGTISENDDFYEDDENVVPWDNDDVETSTMFNDGKTKHSSIDEMNVNENTFTLSLNRTNNKFTTTSSPKLHDKVSNDPPSVVKMSTFIQNNKVYNRTQDKSTLTNNNQRPITTTQANNPFSQGSFFQNNFYNKAIQKIVNNKLFKPNGNDDNDRTQHFHDMQERINSGQNVQSKNVITTTEASKPESSYENDIKNMFATMQRKNSIVITPNKRRQQASLQRNQQKILEGPEQISSDVLTTTTTTQRIYDVIFQPEEATITTTTTTKSSDISTTAPTVVPNDPWSMFNFLKNIVKIG